jgi:transcriptional regulator with XRE-family HTH domain
MTPDPVRRLARTIRNLRLKQKLSQEEYAERADVHRNYVGLIERGERTPNLRNLIKLAKGLGLKPSDLLRAALL